MKIAFINQPWNNAEPPVQSGSIAIWIYQVSQHLSQSCDVIVYGKRDRLRKKEESQNGIHYRYVSIYLDHKVDKIRKIPKKKVFKYFSGFFNSKRPGFSAWWYYGGYVLQVALDLRKRECDVVHITNFSQFVPIIRAFNPGIKIVLHMQCEWLTQLDRTMIEKRLQQVDLVVSCSAYITEKIQRRFPRFANRCQTVFNGVDVNYFVDQRKQHKKEKNDTKNILFVGRVSPEKGAHILLKAFQQVVKHFSQVKLEIVGPVAAAPVEFIIALDGEDKVQDLVAYYDDGGYFQQLQDKLSGDMKRRVVFPGAVPHSELINYYQNASVFVFPSVWNEPFGIPVVEAMASGVPVVSTRGGGIVETVDDGITGLLVERGNAQALAEATLSLLQDENLRESMGKAARKRAVEFYSWERITENLLQRYEEILK